MGIASSIVSAECILKSDWGNHQIAKKENNLSLLEKDPFWKNKGIEYQGFWYRTYDNWLEFSIDLGEYYCFSKLYDEVLKSNNLDLQLDNLIPIYGKEFSDKIEIIIERFGLWEFDEY